jgi:hypothetical protein
MSKKKIKQDDEDLQFVLNPFLLVKQYDGDLDKTVQKEVLSGSFEHRICEAYLRAINCPTKEWRKFPVNEYGLITFSVINAAVSVGILEQPIDLLKMFEKPKPIIDKYNNCESAVVIYKDFKKARYGGIAMTDLSVSVEDMVGNIFILQDATYTTPLLVGKPEHIFKSLVNAGHMSRWMPDEDLEDLEDN